MHKTIKEIEATLRSQYTPPHALLFLGRGPDDRIKMTEFKKETGVEVPVLMEEYYEWMMQVDFGITKGEHRKYFGMNEEIKYPNNQEYDIYFNCSFKTESLSGILRNTNRWREIQKRQKQQEWKSGFLEICNWNGNYVMVIDTKGEVSTKGCILFWDHKGDSVYRILYGSFENYLATKLELLKRELYFPPVLKDANGNEDFFYGKTKKLIDAAIKDMNTTLFVDFNSQLPFIPETPQQIPSSDHLTNKRIKITNGTFNTFQGIITGIDGDKINVEVEVFGRTKSATIEKKDFELL